VVVVLTALDEQADTVTARNAMTARREGTLRGREVKQRDMGITLIVSVAPWI
jgi:hypothetical protein